jgi:hypothetical protein
MPRTYVKQVIVELKNYKNTESVIDAAIQKETDTGAVFKTISSFTDVGAATYVIVFERP